MRARLIAAALDSVYAIDLEGQVSSIERGSEGFWGPWQGAGLAAKRIVHAGTVVATIGPDHHASALVRGGYDTWHTWPRPADELAAVYVPGQGPILFATDRHAVCYARRETPHTPWTDWEVLGGPLAEIQAAVVPDGGAALFGIRHGTVFVRTQNRSLAAWDEWTGLGVPPDGARALRVTSLRGGGLAVFALAGDGRIHHRWQDVPFGEWRAWEELGGSVRTFAVTRSPQGGSGALRRLRRRLRAVPVPARAIQRLERLAGPAWPCQEPGGSGQLHRRPRGVCDRNGRRGLPQVVRAGRLALDRMDGAGLRPAAIAGLRPARAPAPGARSSSFPFAGSQTAHRAAPAASPRRS